ncbi:unnamed protein product [Vitrella brassicaformis CCMP3155]|uniref:Uncharacterized protein n=1 Tax=Vitrella brassicaformis (strain CCMP3155) TaxID=1169540 RepID=A0A0G4GVV5_VITBC|nr:unnamed protein product [Vitrella brassicaformis CCMP3155]|eukprot:CEM35099.1 unnamed protein product [Vitrella brassicaformis CCMP3155]
MRERERRWRWRQQVLVEGVVHRVTPVVEYRSQLSQEELSEWLPSVSPLSPRTRATVGEKAGDITGRITADLRGPSRSDECGFVVLKQALQAFRPMETVGIGRTLDGNRIEVAGVRVGAMLERRTSRAVEGNAGGTHSSHKQRGLLRSLSLHVTCDDKDAKEQEGEGSGGEGMQCSCGRGREKKRLSVPEMLHQPAARTKQNKSRPSRKPAPPQS